MLLGNCRCNRPFPCETTSSFRGTFLEVKVLGSEQGTATLPSGWEVRCWCSISHPALASLKLCCCSYSYDWCICKWGFFNIKIIPTDFLCAYLRKHGDKPYQRSQGWYWAPGSGAQLHPNAEQHHAPWAVLLDQILGVNQDVFFEVVLLYPIEGWGHWSKILGSCWWARFFFCEVVGLQMKNTTGRCFLNSCIKPASISRLKWFPSASTPCSWSSLEIVGERGRLPCKN